MKDTFSKITLGFYERLTSRKFLIIVAGITLLILDATQRLMLTPEQETLITGMIVGYLGVEGYIDSKKEE